MVLLSPFCFIEDSESNNASLPLLLHVSSNLTLPLFSELLKRKNWKFCFSLGLLLSVSSFNFSFNHERGWVFSVLQGNTLVTSGP